MNPSNGTSASFKERFKGKTSVINKDGHIGVVISSNQPVKKMDSLPMSQPQSDYNGGYGSPRATGEGFPYYDDKSYIGSESKRTSSNNIFPKPSYQPRESNTSNLGDASKQDRVNVYSNNYRAMLSGTPPRPSRGATVPKTPDTVISDSQQSSLFRANPYPSASTGEEYGNTNLNSSGRIPQHQILRASYDVERHNDFSNTASKNILGNMPDVVKASPTNYTENGYNYAMKPKSERGSSLVIEGPRNVDKGKLTPQNLPKKPPLAGFNSSKSSIAEQFQRNNKNIQDQSSFTTTTMSMGAPSQKPDALQNYPPMPMMAYQATPGGQPMMVPMYNPYYFPMNAPVPGVQLPNMPQYSPMQHPMMIPLDQASAINQASAMNQQSSLIYRPGISMTPPTGQRHLSGTNIVNRLQNNVQMVGANTGLDINDVMRSGPSSPKNTSSQSTMYKPYTLKEYKDQRPQKYYQLGGLGAVNVGTDEWEKGKLKREAALEFAKNVKAINQQKIIPRRPKEPEKKEPSAREKAKEFSKNVPKPKGRPNNPEDNSNVDFADGGSEPQLSELELLELRHEEQSRAVNNLKNQFMR